MTSRLVARTGVLTPLYFGNPTAPQSGAEVVHDPWSQGIAGYLIQAAAASTTVSLSSGESWTATPDSVSLLTDADPGQDPGLIEACGVDALFLNGPRYLATGGANLRWIEQLEAEGSPPEPNRIDYAFVVHTLDQVAYRIQLVDGVAQVTLDLPATGLRLLQLVESGHTTVSLAEDVVITLGGSNDLSESTLGGGGTDGGGSTGGGEGDGGQTPWPPA